MGPNHTGEILGGWVKTMSSFTPQVMGLNDKETGTQ